MAFSIASANEINEYIGKSGTLVVDLRDKDDYRKAHIATAINIPYEEFEDNRFKLDGYSTIIIYCDRGNTSLLVAKEYNNKGPLVLTLGGGFNRNKAKFVIDGME